MTLEAEEGGRVEGWWWGWQVPEANLDGRHNYKKCAVYMYNAKYV
jgi:hypothetical protein